MSRHSRPVSKGRPTPKRATQKRRRYLLWALTKHTADRRQWRGAVALYTLMLNRWSDDDAKGVFPSQVRMAAELGCSDRQIRRYLVLLIAAGFLTVLPGKRHPRPDGTWHRSNILYLFRFPPKRVPCTDRTSTASHPPSERKNRAPQAAAVHPTTDVPAGTPLAAPPTPTPPSPESTAIAHAALADARAALRQLKPTPNEALARR